MSYYLVRAKCGHVGKGKYHEVDFPVYANSKSEAAQICLKKAKVKKHLKNAISVVNEITHEDYIYHKELIKQDTFVRAHTKKEIESYIETATELYTDRPHKKKSFENRKQRILFKLKRQKIKEELIYA